MKTFAELCIEATKNQYLPLETISNTYIISIHFKFKFI